MTYRGHLSRAEIGLRPPRSRSTRISPSRGGVAEHYAGPAQRVSTALSGHSRCLALWRGFQDFHMRSVSSGGRGWVDIAYTMGCCQHGYLLAGRGVGVRTAATGPANGSFYAICAILGEGERPTKDLLDAMEAGIAMLRAAGAGMAVHPHRRYMSTSCPGDFLAQHAASVDGRPIGAARPSPPEEDVMASLDDVRKAVREEVGRLAATVAAEARRTPEWHIARRVDGAIFAAHPGRAERVTPAQWQVLSAHGYEVSPRADGLSFEQIEDWRALYVDVTNDPIDFDQPGPAA